MIKEISIIGNGRTARAMCGYLMSRGVNVRLWGRDKDKVSKLCKEGISLTGCIEGKFYPSQIETDSDLSLSDYLFVMTTSSGHADVAKLLKGKLKKGQRIVIFNGNWGAVEFAGILGDELAQKEIIVSETGAMIFLADYVGDSVHVKKIKENISLGSFPSDMSKTVVDELSSVLPQLVPSDSVLSTSINNSNPVIHTPVTLFNITRIENGEDFYFYGDASTKRVIDFIESIDKERCNVAKAIGAKVETCLEIINSFWIEKHDNLFDAIKQNKAYQSGKGPTSLDYRYITEDVPFGMAPVSYFGKVYNVDTPYIDTMLKTYDLILGEKIPKAPDFTNVDISKFK